jgi:[acyl-carrier-protein] S-malonyltransferase
VFDRANALLDYDLKELCFEGPSSQLDDTQFAQPAILTTSIAYLEALRERFESQGENMPIDYVAGHSLGEYTALVAAGSLDFEDALLLVKERGRLMKEEGTRRPGGMAAVIGLADDRLKAVVKEASSEGVVVIANSNSPIQTVISGEIAALLKAMDLARHEGAAKVARLAVSIASHSPLMQQAGEQLSAFIRGIKFTEPKIPLIGNIAGHVLTSTEDIRRELADQLCKPVAWVASVRKMVENGVTTFVEVGPGQVLGGLIKRISSEAHVVHWDELMKTPGSESLPHLHIPVLGNRKNPS